jgi:hypothetical protein
MHQLCFQERRLMMPASNPSNSVLLNGFQRFQTLLNLLLGCHGALSFLSDI